MFAFCTSRNALPIAKSFKEDTLIFLPDKFMGENLAERNYLLKPGKNLYSGMALVRFMNSSNRILLLQ